MALIALVLAVAAPALAFEGQDYSLELPDGWVANEYVDGAQYRRVEYIYGERSQGLLRIKRVRSTQGEDPGALSDRDSEMVLRYQPGYVRGRSEKFGGGHLSGVVTQYEFTNGGRPMLGRNYYLRGDDTTIWVLQFTGERNTLRQARPETDRIARSFQPR
jgi:hypothetical protein